MAIYVALLALLVAWLSLVKSRQNEELVDRLRRDTIKLTQRQQQILRELGHDDQAQAAEQGNVTSAAAEPEVEEVEMTAPAQERA